MRVKWTDPARDDFQQIREYYKDVASHKLHDLNNVILDAVNRAARNPYVGRMIPEEENQHEREVFAWKYRIMYRVHENDGYIEILAIYHMAQHFTGFD